MAFTLAADFFLVLRGAHTAGVAVFCFVHICYMCRKLGAQRVAYLFIPVAVLTTILAANGWIIALAALYATLFAANITIHTIYRTHGHSGNLILAALILFALCDISVMLYNLPHYTGAPIVLRRAYPLIWLFYVPSQAMLAVSAVSAVGVKGKKEEHE
jgi:hypothetical protein